MAQEITIDFDGMKFLYGLTILFLDIDVNVFCDKDDLVSLTFGRDLHHTDLPEHIPKISEKSVE